MNEYRLAKECIEYLEEGDREKLSQYLDLLLGKEKAIAASQIAYQILNDITDEFIAVAVEEPVASYNAGAGTEQEEKGAE